ncbi:MAG: ABC transporter substrate-binding protein, partial [Rhodobacterales bacterium]|nr:ABC transporter substrate-binding protein [Rhodobacterales bacterium]
MIRQNAIARLLAAAAPLAAALFLAPAAPAAADEIRVMSDRTPSHLEPLFARYQETTGVKISPVFVEKGLVSRVQARPTEADVIITSTADILEKARRDGLLRPIASDVVKALDDRYRGPDDTYVIDAYRARAIYVSRDRVKPGTVTRYEDLLKPEWKGRVCIRSGYHRYNMALFAQMIADRGEAWTRDFMTRLRDNLARKPKGNDRNQVRG